MIYTNKIIHGNCVEVLRNLPHNSFDICITSPPYNVDLGNNKYNKNTYDTYSDDMPYPEYIKWLKLVFSEVLRTMKPGGRICINIGDGQNGRIPTHADITNFMVNEFKCLMMTTIIWEKSQISNRTSWGSWLSPSCPSFPTPFEYIMVFAKESIKLLDGGETDIQKQEFIDWSLAHWKITPETQTNTLYNHPAMFPLDVPYRLLKMLSWKDSHVLDPFSGMGTTAVAAKMLNRNYTGIEISENYVEKSRQRVDVTKESFF